MFYSPVQDLQRPTHPRLRIRDARDAQIVLEAVRSGVLQPVERRLNEGERNMFIRSGAVFVWEESDDEYGIKRWVDSISCTGALPVLRGKIITRIQSRPAPHSQFPGAGGHSMGLIKQAYSAWTSDPRSSNRRKWHITAYFSQADLNGLPTPVEDPCFRNVAIPSGVYRSGKARTKDPETDADANGRSGLQKGYSSHHSSSYHYSSASTPTPRSSASPGYDGRLPEDQRLIRMLNSQHIM
ncbi:Gti1/Pac2 family-domain-containing protein [Gautieria morchelliformis]|nr:Gti1/Pac2 family-domain-containing protein [Gautieria morchelliformis]